MAAADFFLQIGARFDTPAVSALRHPFTPWRRLPRPAQNVSRLWPWNERVREHEFLSQSLQEFPLSHWSSHTGFTGDEVTFVDKLQPYG